MFTSLLVLLSVHVAVESCGEAKRKLPPFGKPMREEFFLRPNFSYLNHGASGPFPKVVLKAMQSHQELAEEYPDIWFRKYYPKEMRKIRILIAELMNADPEDIVIIPNVTYGMNVVIKAIAFRTGERILHFCTVYEGVKGTIKYVIDRSNGAVSNLVFNVTYPISNEELVKNFEDFLIQNHDPLKPIRLAVLDHISSVPSVIVPIDKLIPVLKQYNISVVVDGAHAIGHVPIDIQALDPDYYVTGLHKWLFVARGFGAMYVKKHLQEETHPLQITSRYLRPPAKDRFQEEFFWMGTTDFSSYMSLPTALQFIQDAGGLTEINKYNHNLALEGGRKVASQLGTEVIQREEQMGNMVDVKLPLKNPNGSRFTRDFWPDMFFNKYNVTYMKIYKHDGHFWARLSTQIYNDLSDFDVAADTFTRMCEEVNNS